ncbi:MAG: hypothetical protein R2799_05655 [Crocinitomicaceae bacterium]
MLIPEEYKGNGLSLNCKRCNKRVSKIPCAHKNDWYYVLTYYIPKSGGERKTMFSKSRNLVEALQELEEFKRQYRDYRPLKITKEFTLKEGIERFFQKKFSEEEFKNNSKTLSHDHKTEIVRVIGRFCEAIKLMGLDPDSLFLNDLNERCVAPFYDVIEEYVNSTTSIDKHTRIMRSFIRFLINRGMYNGANFFLTVDTHKIESNPTSISDEEFKSVLNVISTENGWGTKGTSRKINYYRPWIKDFLLLARLTGLRREELYSLSKDSLINVEGGLMFIFVHNYKVERLLNEENIVKVLPVTDELKILIQELLNKCVSNKLIETEMKLGYFSDFLSSSFTHFYKKAFPNKKIKNFNSLRKAYATDVYSILGEEAHKITDHSGNVILEKHYIDKVRAALKMLEKDD